MHKMKTKYNKDIKIINYKNKKVKRVNFRTFALYLYAFPHLYHIWNVARNQFLQVLSL